jgi:hypothetical protein
MLTCGGNSLEVDRMSYLRRSNTMIQRRIFYLFFALICLTCLSCTDNPAGNDPGDDIPTENKPLSGSWVGYFLVGDNGLNTSGNTDLVYDSDDIFTIAIITLEKEARFIGDRSQFVCPEGNLDVNITSDVTKSFGAHFYYYTWDTSGGGEYLADRVEYSIFGNTLTNFYIRGLYWVTDLDNPSPPSWQYELYNYNSAGVYPDIQKLVGEWEIEKSFTWANTLTLIITTNGEDPDSKAIINGTDSRSNHFTGAISIHVDTENPHNVLYDVSLRMNDDIDFQGLATYIENMTSGGENGNSVLHVEKTLAIGATDANHLLTGIAKKIEEGTE